RADTDSHDFAVESAILRLLGLEAEPRLAVRGLRERQHLGGRNPIHVRDVRVAGFVGVAESVVGWREIPIAIVFLADDVSPFGQRVAAGYPFGITLDDDVEAVVPSVHTG